MIDTPVPDSVGAHAAFAPDAAAVVFAGRVLTYRDLDERAADHAASLRRAGEGPGALVAFPARPDPATVVAMVGVPRAGAAMAPFGSHPIPPDGAAAPSGTYAVVATSGSRGRPRGVVLTAGNVAASVAASQRRLENDAEDRWLVCLPLWHIGGLSIVWRSLSAGGSMLLHPGFDAGAVAADLRSGLATIVSLVPTMLRRILEVEPGPYTGLRAVLLGGAPASRDLVERALDAGLPIRQTYGMTEACSQVATVAKGEERDALGTVGLPLEGFAVAIVDDRGSPVPRGVVGEITVAGPAVSPVYLGEELREGPHHSGDLGFEDDEGRLVAVGRKDDMIVSGGENVYPSTVASAVMDLPGVRQCEVFGVPDAEWGEIVVAAVVNDGRTPPELTTMAKERLQPHQVPKRWLVLEEIPVLETGKPDQRALEALAEEGPFGPGSSHG